MIRQEIEQLRASLDRRTVAALLTCAVSVTVLNYTSGMGTLQRHWPTVSGGQWGDLPLWGVRLALRGIFYVFLPLVVARACGVRDLFLGAKDFLRRLRIPALLLLVVMPFVVAASFSADFRAGYPQGHAASRGAKQLALWLVIYGASFFTVELFFRGFLLAMLRPALQGHAVFVATIPYVMIHFNKPPAEAAGSIVTGVVLGALAMSTRSIWYGFIVHVSVAFAMELLALHHAHLFPFA